MNADLEIPDLQCRDILEKMVSKRRINVEVLQTQFYHAPGMADLLPTNGNAQRGIAVPHRPGPISK